jgi:hypothetical protein
MFFVHYLILGVISLGSKVNGFFSGGPLTLTLVDLLILVIDFWFLSISLILRKARGVINIREKEISYDDDVDLGKRAIN